MLKKRLVVIIFLTTIFLYSGCLLGKNNFEKDWKLLIFKSSFKDPSVKLYMYDLSQRRYKLFSENDFTGCFNPVYDRHTERFYFQTENEIKYLMGNQITSIIKSQERIVNYTINPVNSNLYYIRGLYAKGFGLYQFNLATGKESIITDNQIGYLSKVVSMGDFLFYNGKDNYIYMSNITKYSFSKVVKGSSPSINVSSDHLAFIDQKNRLCTYELSSEKIDAFQINNMKNVYHIIWIDRDYLLYTYSYQGFMMIEPVTRLEILNLRTRKQTLLEKNILSTGFNFFSR